MITEPRVSYKRVDFQQAWIRGKEGQEQVSIEPARILDFLFILKNEKYVKCYKIEYGNLDVCYLTEDEFGFCEIMPFKDL